MITPLYKNYKKTHLIVSEGPNGYEIQSGDLIDSKSFIMNQKILISGERPNVLWDLLHDLMGIPYPLLSPPPVPEDISEMIGSFLEEELDKMCAKDIVKKVEVEKGISITNSLKSKKAIIKKALKILTK